tara:strand:+ start:82 stop:549 length:468 start_codon:yes stop_codon:yes gene_type:complete
MSNIKTTATFNLNNLLSDLELGKFVIPDFQREFEWEAWDVRDLVKSIFQDYYIGTLLLWEVKDDNTKTLACEPIRGNKEKAKVKEAAQKLLERLKENEFKVDRWAEKTQTSSAVRKVIEDYLYLELPSPSYDNDISLKADILFNDFKERFADYAA